MVLPARAHYVGVPPSLAAKNAWIEQVLSPGAQGPLDPLADRHSKSRLRPIDELARNQAIELLAGDMLAAAAANLEPERNACGELGDAMVEEWDPGLQRHRHRRSVDLGEDVVGQVADRVAIHH